MFSNLPNGELALLPESKAIAARVDEICQPLKDAFGITHFNYHRLHVFGKMFQLSNDHDWCEYYLERKFYKHVKDLPKVYRSGCFFMDDYCKAIEARPELISPHFSAHETIIEARDKFDFDHSVLIAKNHIISGELIVIGVPKSNIEFTRNFLEYRSLFDEFISHFKSEAKDLFKMLKGREFNVNQIKRVPHSFYDYKKELKKPLQEFKNKLNKDRYLLEGELEGTYLTKREYECVELLAAGYKTREIAEELDIKISTAKQHIENIKLKLRCRSKAKLVERMQTDHILDMLNNTSQLDDDPNCNTQYPGIEDVRPAFVEQIEA